MKKGKILIVVFILLVFSLNVIADQSSQVTDYLKPVSFDDYKDAPIGSVVLGGTDNKVVYKKVSENKWQTLTASTDSYSPSTGETFTDQNMEGVISFGLLGNFYQKGSNYYVMGESGKVIYQQNSANGLWEKKTISVGESVQLATESGAENVNTFLYAEDNNYHQVQSTDLSWGDEPVVQSQTGQLLTPKGEFVSGKVTNSNTHTISTVDNGQLQETLVPTSLGAGSKKVVYVKVVPGQTMPVKEGNDFKTFNSNGEEVYPDTLADPDEQTVKKSLPIVLPGAEKTTDLSGKTVTPPEFDSPLGRAQSNFDQKETVNFDDQQLTFLDPYTLVDSKKEKKYYYDLEDKKWKKSDGGWFGWWDTTVNDDENSLLNNKVAEYKLAKSQLEQKKKEKEELAKLQGETPAPIETLGPQLAALMGGRPEFEPLFDPTSLKKSAGIGYGIDMPNVGNLPDETKNFFQCLDDSCSSRTQTGMQDAGKKIKSIIDSGGKVKKCDLVGCVMEPAGGSEVLVSYNDQVKSAEIIINGNVGEESYSVVSNSNLGFVKGESVSLERIVEHTWKASGTKEIHSVVVDDDGNIQEIITKSGKIVTKDDSEFQKMLTNWGNLEKGLNDYYSYGVDPKIIPAVSGPSYLPETFTDGSGDVWELQGDGTYKVYDQQLGTTLIGGLNEDGRMEVLFAKDENGQGAVGLIFDSATTTALPTLSQAERELQSAKSFEGIVEDTKRGLSFTDDNKVVDVLSGEVYYYEDGQWYRERNNWFDKTLDENDAKFLTASRNSYLASKNALGTRKELDKVVPQKLKVAATNDDSYNLRILSPEEREKTGYSYAYVSANSDGEKIIYLDGNKNFLAYSLDGGDTFKTKEDETIVPSLMAAMKLEEKSLKIELPKGKSSLKDNDAYLITALSALGYDISDPDKAIRAFQSDHELKDDGAAGENTLAALNADLVKNGLTKGVEVEEKTVTSNVDSATPLAGKVTAYQKEHLTPEIISAIESNGVAVVEDGKYSRDADGNIIFEGADGMILKIGKTEEETEELSEGESTIDFEEEETTVVTPKEVLDAKSGLPITEDKVFNVPAGAKTGKELFGTGAACKDCQYWKQGDKYYRYNPETGEVTEVLSTAKGYNTLTESNLPEVKVTPSQPKPNQPTSHEQEVKAKVNAVLKDLQARKITHGEASEMIEALAKEEEAYLKENSLWHETQLKVDNVLKQNGIAGKTVPETVTTFDLDNIGKGLNIQREPDMDDNAYRELINKKLGEINAYLDKDSKLYKDLMEKADSLYWQGDWLEAMGPEAYDILVSGDWSGGHIIGGIAGFAGQLGKYRALSNLLFPETTQDWLEWSNSEFLLNWADLPGFASREWCGYDEAKRYSEPGKSTAFVGTVSGTYQFVGSIQAEKSSYKIPISCKLNPNYDGMPSSDLVDVSMLSMPATGQAFYNTEDEWICNNEQVCKDDGFCYLTEKSEEPVKGYYYKITWGVSAPTDEKFTPYVDENGKAVKFNLKLFGNDQKWVFKRQGAFGTSVIALNNGAQDSGTIVSYLAEDYYQVCIVFDSNYKVSDYENDVVKDICTNFLDVSTGYVDYNGDVDSIVSSSSGVSVNI